MAGRYAEYADILPGHCYGQKGLSSQCVEIFERCESKYPDKKWDMDDQKAFYICVWSDPAMFDVSDFVMDEGSMPKTKKKHWWCAFTQCIKGGKEAKRSAMGDTDY